MIFAGISVVKFGVLCAMTSSRAFRALHRSGRTADCADGLQSGKAGAYLIKLGAPSYLHGKPGAAQAVHGSTRPAKRPGFM